MSFLSWLASFFTQKATEAIKGGVETVAAGTEIPKNLIETEKAHLEVKELKRAETERAALVVPATLEDVKEFDPKYQELRVIEQQQYSYSAPSPRDPLRSILVFVLILIGFALAFPWIQHMINAVFKVSGQF